VGFCLEEEMKTQATFFHTSRGYLNLALVRLIDDKSDAETIKFIFDDVRGSYIALRKREGEVVILKMVNEMLIAE
jgi:hypothetical protein